MATTVVGFVGRLSSEKDPDAALRLALALPTITVVVVGDGPLRPALAGGPPNLKVVGPDADQGGVYAALDLVIVPSRYESFGLTIGEACWLGIPVISTPVGLAAIRPGLTRTIPIGADGATLAAAVRADLEDPAGTAARVADAKAWTRANLAADRFAREYAALLVGLAPAVVAGKIAAILSGQVSRSALSPRLDEGSRIDTCPFSGGCFCNARQARPCSHVNRPAMVDRGTCEACQRGEMDDAS